MPNDWSKPDNATTYTSVLGLIRDELAAVAKMLFTGDSNIPTNAIQWENTDKQFQRESGGSFTDIGGLVPVASILPYAGASAPAGYLLCDGSVVAQATYASLFAVVGTLYDTGGEGGGNFRLPDLRQRFPLGKAASGTGATLGSSGGNIDHTHSVPAHYHGMGTGADLNITAGGSHTHTIDHDHAQFDSGSTAPATDSQGAHRHYVCNTDLDNNALSTTEYLCRSFDAVNDFSYDLRCSTTDANRALTSSNGAHTHTVASHLHTVNVPAFTGSSGSDTHTHTSGTFSGRIGLVTGGVDGNAAMTSGTGNPPFLVVQYIIKV